MNKHIILSIALSMALLGGCGQAEKKPGEEYYDTDYRAKSDSAYEENAKNQAMTKAPAAPSEQVGPNASTHSAASEAPAVEKDKTDTKTPEQTVAAAVATKAATDEAPKQEAKPVAAAGGNFDKGKALLSKSDCLACHKVDQKIVGPAYNDVAKKYEANEKNYAYLSNKIIKGGAGVWGDVPMSPHPTLAPADAKEMAKYILSLR